MCAGKRNSPRFLSNLRQSSPRALFPTGSLSVDLVNATGRGHGSLFRSLFLAWHSLRHAESLLITLRVSCLARPEADGRDENWDEEFRNKAKCGGKGGGTEMQQKKFNSSILTPSACFFSNLMFKMQVCVKFQRKRTIGKAPADVCLPTVFCFYFLKHVHEEWLLCFFELPLLHQGKTNTDLETVFPTAHECFLFFF